MLARGLRHFGQHDAALRFTLEVTQRVEAEEPDARVARDDVRHLPPRSAVLGLLREFHEGVAQVQGSFTRADLHPTSLLENRIGFEQRERNPGQPGVQAGPELPRNAGFHASYQVLATDV